MNISCTYKSWEEYLYWQTQDKKVLKKINSLIKDIKRDPYDGVGKPEQLKHELSGCWSRKITDEHRIVYEIYEFYIIIIGCRYHY